MKRVLITGANSYVGTNVEKWLMKKPDKYYVETLDMQDPNWKAFDFSSFDVVFHVAGIAHVSTKMSMKNLYFKVNRDLAIETAIKAKDSGVKQFIFMSSMIVYNSKETRITRETKPNPDNFYGESKLQAEKRIFELHDNEFNICILRPPMIYGLNSKGNFIKLLSLAKNAFIFPKYNNKRSLLFINNLAIFVDHVISHFLNGVFYPQNPEYISTSGLVINVRNILNKKGIYPKIFNWIIKLFVDRVNIFNKIFGDYFYDFHEQFLINIYDLNSSLKIVLETGDDE